MGNAVAAVVAGLDGLVHPPLIASRPEHVDALLDALRAGRTTVVTTTVGVAALRDHFAQSGESGVAAMFEGQLRWLQYLIGVFGQAGDDIVVLGTDALQIAPGEGLFREMELVAEAGLGPMQVIQAATRNAGAHIARTQDLGTVEAGKLADLVVVDGNPLEDLSVLQNVQLVVKGGDVVVSPMSR